MLVLVYLLSSSIQHHSSKPKGVIHATATSLYKPLQASKTPSGYPCIDKAAVKASRAVLERSGSIAGFCRMQVLEGMEDIEDNKQLC